MHLHSRFALIYSTAALLACSVAPINFTPEDAGPPDGSPPDMAMFSVHVELIGNGGGVIMSAPQGVVCPGTCRAAFPSNTTVELLAIPSQTSTFMGWGGACRGTATCSFTVTADTTAIAAFATNNELIVMPAGNGSGTVRSTPGGISCGGDCVEPYPPGTVVTLEAVAADDSNFTGWSGAGCVGTGTCLVTIGDPVMIRATFVLRQHALQVLLSGDGNGTVSSTPGGISCATDCIESYDAHTEVTLTASADSESTFVGWLGGDCTSTGTCRIAMDTPVTITAVFARRQFMLTVAITGDGSGTVQSSPAGISCGPDCSEPYDARTVVTLTATPGSGSTFAGWSGACSGTGACEVAMSSARSVVAQFSLPSGLFVINDDGGRLERFDPSTLRTTDIGPLGVGYAFGDCAWNPADSTLYVVDGRGARALYRVDLVTGAATLVGMHGISDMFALAYHPPTDKLYGMTSTGSLYAISATTGAATLLGRSSATDNFNGLVWDPVRNRLIALTGNPTRFFSVDVSSAEIAEIQPTDLVNNQGMTYDPRIDRLWVADVNSNFWQFDPANGLARTLITRVPGRRTCIAFVSRTPLSHL